MIKKIVSLACVVLSCMTLLRANDEVLLTIDGKPVYASEFEYIYTKNNASGQVEKQTVDEYLDLFVNFKLKVADACLEGLDTTQSFVAELTGYRNQLARPYLTDKAEEDRLMEEAYNRKLENVKIAHIAFKLPDNPTVADTLAAYTEAMTLRDKLIDKKKQKPLDFEKAALEYSDDPTVQENKGVLGWVSIFRFLYPLECAAYNTPVGEISMPIRTRFGYHLVKVLERVPSVGQISVSHIMLFTSRNNDSINERAAFLIDSLYQRLEAGDDFALLARQYSQDRGTSVRDGQLPWLGRGDMASEPDFEEAAFALKEIGEFSEPIRSNYGYHIIKLLDKRPVLPYEQQKEELRRNVERDSRSELIKTSFIDKMKTKYQYVAYPENWVNMYAWAAEYDMTDSVFMARLDTLQKVFFAIGEKEYIARDFADYLRKNVRRISQSIPEEAVKSRINDFINASVLAVADANLENEYPDFRNLMHEYHDGILLFEISNREVWERASQDVEGLSAYFTANRTDYEWAQPHYKGFVIYCKDKPTMKAAKAISKYTALDSLENYLYRRLNDSVQYVKLERGLYVEGDDAAVDRYVFKKKGYKPSEDYPFVFVKGTLLKKLPESYEDVRGAVTADYQAYLEQQWLADMRTRHKVVIDEKVLDRLRNRLGE
ncbi:MAG: peptidylprolyl isomerase [Bacteroidetes bacterium]|uniref:Peptidylprolyl isomerase n=1 Tax=Candidatus Gallipaludibacter merdavium TaxID=2840839 RepID=A0A9D9HS85_9BACT|nr:peptidylprolyl isomerase [Candidatus Gallipaludibacter merdavium]